MRATVIRRTAVTASAVSLALLATACGGAESGGEDKGGKAKESAAATPAAVKALTAAELEKLMVVDGELKDHGIKKAGPGDIVAAKDVTVDKAGCEPLAYAMYGVPLGKSVATAKRKVIDSSNKKSKDAAAEGDMTAAFDQTMTLAGLSSYDGKGAEEAVAGLRTAATACAGGFTLTMSGTKQKVVKISEVKVSGGEEAVAWTVVSEQDGEKMPFKIAAVRKGAVVASFTSINMASIATGKDYALPTALINAQVAKLG